MQEFTSSQSGGTAHSVGSLAKLRAICWRLRRDASQATCSLHSHPARWELRLEIDGRVERVEAFGAPNLWIPTAVQWRGTLNAQGWQ